MSDKENKALELDEGFDSEFENDFEDDFYDDVLEDSFDDDLAEALDTEYHDDFDDEFPESHSDLLTEKKKSGFRLSFNTLVIAGAVLIGAIVLFVQVTKAPPRSGASDNFRSTLTHQGADDGVMAVNNAQSDRSGSKENANQTESVEIVQEIQDQGFLFEPDILNSMEEELNAIPQPVPVAEIEIEAPPSELIEKNIEDIVDLVVPNDGIDDDLLPTSNIQEPRAPDIVNLNQPQDATDTEDVTNTSDDLVKAAQEVAEVTEVLDEDSRQSAQTDKVNQDIPSVIDLSSIEDKLDQISNRLETMDVQINQIQGEFGDKIQDMQQNVEKLEGRIQNVSQRPRPKVRKATSNGASSRKSAVSKSVKAPAWELKAAQPGKAWISHKGSSNLRAVQVGERVEGLGKIQSITYDGSRWLLVGSDKTLNQ